MPVVSSDEDGDVLLRLPSIRSSGLAVLDGGFATHLEDVLQKDISASPLWSAALLQSEDGCRAIVATHLAFLRAGAQMFSTSTYQASLLSLTLAGISHDAAEALIVRSVELAQEAREHFVVEQHENVPITRPLLALSIGPYGAAMSNGAEYTGDYHVPETSAPPTLDDLIDFHYRRLAAVASRPDAWKHVDVLAFETIPRLDEVTAIRHALAQLYGRIASAHRPPAFVSFVFPNGKNLPWPSNNDNLSDAAAMTSLVQDVLASAVDQAPLQGIGINCTKPRFLAELVQRLTEAVKSARPSRRPYLFLYPDGGLVWDGIHRVWRDATSDDSGATQHTEAWYKQVLQAARLAVPSTDEGQQQATWAGCFVGGCCKSTTSDIADLQRAIVGRQRDA